MTTSRSKMKPSNSESVDQPDHYALDGGIECIDSMVAVFGLEATQKYAEIAAFKYLWRMNKKSKTSVEDKLKAIWYLRFSMGDDPRNDLKVQRWDALDEAESENATITAADYEDPYDL